MQGEIDIGNNGGTRPFHIRPEQRNPGMEPTLEHSRRGVTAIRRLALTLIAGAAIVLATPQIALAQANRGGDWHGGGGDGRGDGDPRGGGGHPQGAWRGTVGAWHGGRWYQGWHSGRYGWWWAVPGYDWYAYDEPAYPYPAYPNTGYPGAPTAPYFWYYCQSPPGYYPYVEQCATPWQPVPAPG
jgi:hypothetical protein